MSVSNVYSMPFNIVAKPCGPSCNMSCQYCYYRKTLTSQSIRRISMPLRVLRAYIEQYIHAQPSDELLFIWHGGEPTLCGIPFFQQVLKFQHKYNSSGKRIVNVLQTNGLLIDEEWGRFLAAERFFVGISIDGPASLHNYYRKDISGHGTLDTVLNALSILQEHEIPVNVLTTVNDRNVKSPQVVYNFIKTLGVQFIQFIPVVERRQNGDIEPFSVQPLDYGLFLCGILDDWLRSDSGKISVQNFDVAFEGVLRLPRSLCVFAETCGYNFALERNGDLFVCDHFVDIAHKLGNITEKPLLKLISNKRAIKFGQAKTKELPAYCRQCEVRSLCNGGCPKNRFGVTPDGEEGLNYLCAGYKLFFEHVAGLSRQFTRTSGVSGKSRKGVTANGHMTNGR